MSEVHSETNQLDLYEYLLHASTGQAKLDDEDKALVREVAIQGFVLNCLVPIEADEYNKGIQASKDLREFEAKLRKNDYETEANLIMNAHEVFSAMLNYKWKQSQ